MKSRAFVCTLMLLSLTLCLSSGAHASPRESTIVSLYDQPDFKGHAMHFELSTNEWAFRLEDKGINDWVSSINVPAGLVVIVYEHAGGGGGYGRWVDFLEAQPNLAKYDLDKKISYLHVFRRVAPDGKYWVRNGYVSGQFMEGYWFKSRKGGGPPYNPTAVVAPPKPAPPPTPCTVSGRVTNDRPQYRTSITLYLPNGTRTQFSVGVTGGRYTILNVPEGSYEVRGKGSYPTYATPRGPTGLGIFAQGSQAVTCEGGRPVGVDFDVHSTEG